MRALTLAIAALLAAGCSGSSGPKPAELTEIENPRQVRTLWSTPVGRVTVPGGGGHFRITPNTPRGTLIEARLPRSDREVNHS